MSIKTRISLVIISAVLLSACGAKVENAPQAPLVEPGVSLREVLGQGTSQVCTLVTPMSDENGVTIGNNTTTIYISGKKVAQETLTTYTDPKMPSLNVMMVFDGTTIYTWNPVTKEPGISFTSTEPFGSSDGQTINQNVDLDDKINIKCTSWAVDESKLAIPTDITFTDLSEMMKNIPTMPAGIPTEE